VVPEKWLTGSLLNYNAGGNGTFKRIGER
jgi:hypothetical protein